MRTNSKRRHSVLARVVITALGVAVALGASLWKSVAMGDGTDTILVVKSPTCGCCSKWADYLRQEGFKVQVRNENDMAQLKRDLGVPPNLASCHTATVAGYVIEGHVPAKDIRRLLTDKPIARGLALPGMPIGSPGMEQGERRDPYTTFLFKADGQSQLFMRHELQP